MYILQIFPPPGGGEFFQVIWGRFSRHNIRMASQKEGEGKKKGKRGRKMGKRGKKKGKRGKKRERGRKKMLREGKKIFLKVLGKVFNSIMC